MLVVRRFGEVLARYRRRDEAQTRRGPRGTGTSQRRAVPGRRRERSRGCVGVETDCGRVGKKRKRERSRPSRSCQRRDSSANRHLRRSLRSTSATALLAFPLTRPSQLASTPSLRVGCCIVQWRKRSRSRRSSPAQSRTGAGACRSKLLTRRWILSFALISVNGNTRGMHEASAVLYPHAALASAYRWCR